MHVMRGLSTRAQRSRGHATPRRSPQVATPGTASIQRTIASPELTPTDLLGLQQRVGNRAINRMLDGRAPLRRHSDAALVTQISPFEDEKKIQLKRDPSLQRHPIQPPADTLKPARMPFRRIDEAKRIFADENIRADIVLSMKRMAKQNLPASEFEAKKNEIDQLKWTLDAGKGQPNPAQAVQGSVTIWFSHENYYFPDGSPRTEFIKTVMIHEATHATSLHGTGFQGLDVPFTKGYKTDSLDEAVTDRIGSELASSVLGRTEKYTSQYWNTMGRKGLDFHLTSAGLEKLVDSNPSVWLGDLVDVITSLTPLTWPQIKRAYLTNAHGENDHVIQQVNAQRAAIEAAWTQRRTNAFTALMGADAISAANWDAKITAAVAAADGKQAAPVALSSDQAKALVDAELATITGAGHQIVPKTDRRSSSKDDWALMVKAAKTSTNIKPPPAGWKATPGMANGPTARSAEEAAVNAEKDDVQQQAQQHVKTFDGGAWAAIAALEKHVGTARRLLAFGPLVPPISWVLVPKPKSDGDPDQAKAGDRLETYLSSKSTGLLADANKGESISSLTGDEPEKPAHATVQGYGGAGYEANGDVAFVTQEHVNIGTVLHEMGHHKQKYNGLSEDTVGRVPLLLDFHNVILNENKLAANDLDQAEESRKAGKTGKFAKGDPDPHIRLRYAESPARLRISAWQTLAAAKATKESDGYITFRDRMQARGGEYATLVQDIENALGDANLYPGNIPFLFKNYMIEEIRRRKGDVEFSDAT